MAAGISIRSEPTLTLRQPERQNSFLNIALLIYCIQGCRSLLRIGGIICNFTLILPYFQHWGMNLDHDFLQLSKLSEDQKKGLRQKWNTFFPRVQVKTKKKYLHQNWSTFFPRILVETCSQTHTQARSQKFAMGGYLGGLGANPPVAVGQRGSGDEAPSARKFCIFLQI